MNDVKAIPDFESEVLEECFFKIGKVQYVSVEADVEAATQYRNRLVAGTTFDENGKPESVTSIADVEPLIVALCTFRVERDEKSELRKPLTEEDVRKWPSRHTKRIFAWIKDISELAEREEAITCCKCGAKLNGKGKLYDPNPTAGQTSEQKS